MHIHWREPGIDDKHGTYHQHTPAVGKQPWLHLDLCEYWQWYPKSLTSISPLDPPTGRSLQPDEHCQVALYICTCKHVHRVHDHSILLVMHTTRNEQSKQT